MNTFKKTLAAMVLGIPIFLGSFMPVDYLINRNTLKSKTLINLFYCNIYHYTIGNFTKFDKNKIKEVKVALAVDENCERNIHNIEKLVSEVSEEFKEEFGIKFEVVSYNFWDSDDEEIDSSELIKEAYKEVGLVNNADILLIFTGQDMQNSICEYDKENFKVYKILKKFVDKSKKDSKVHMLLEDLVDFLVFIEHETSHIKPYINLGFPNKCEGYTYFVSGESLSLSSAAIIKDEYWGLKDEYWDYEFKRLIKHELSHLFRTKDIKEGNEESIMNYNDYSTKDFDKENSERIKKYKSRFFF